MDTDRIAALAKEMSDNFVRRTRHSGEEYVCVREGAPAWMTEVCHKAHGDMMPDDHRYRMIERACDAIHENDGDEDAARTSAEEADAYTSDLTAWLASHVERLGYCDHIIEEIGKDAFTDTLSLLQLGQAHERGEVFYLVWEALRERAEELDAEEWDDMDPAEREERGLGEDSDNA